MCFTNLADKNYWMDNAKKLKHFNTTTNLTVSFQADLPPVLREIQNDILLKRKNLSSEEKKESYIRYLPNFPYVTLHTKGKPAVVSSISKQYIIDKLCKLKSG